MTPESFLGPARTPQQQHEVENKFGDNTEPEELHEELRPDSLGSTHHPSAPPDELFDMSTTVDPSYIISLIRELLPTGGREGDDFRGPAALSNTSGQIEDRLTSPNAIGYPNGPNGNLEAMEIPDGDLNQTPRSEEKESARERVWEESGCVLWDLAASKEHAEFMVQNFVLDVLLANIMTSDSGRIREISLGIIGNLACHEVLMNQITSTNKMLEMVVNQLFSDDAACLCEACRLLTLGIQGLQSVLWAKELQSEDILSRVLWIAENTLNPVLIAKSVGLFLAIMENQEVVPVLLPTLMKLGLLNLLANLLAFEMGKLTGDRVPERYPALDSILRAIEALSVIDDYSEELCSNKEVAYMAMELLKISENVEISSSCVTAAVILANVLADAPDLALDMSKDLILLQSVLDLFPFTSDDPEAKNALWSLLARLLVPIQETEMSAFSLNQYASTFTNRLDMIEDVLLDSDWHRSSAAKLDSRTTAIKCIFKILNQRNLLKNEISEEHDDEDPLNHVDEREVQKLIDLCRGHTC